MFFLRVSCWGVVVSRLGALFLNLLGGFSKGRGVVGLPLGAIITYLGSHSFSAHWCSSLFANDVLEDYNSRRKWSRVLVTTEF
jgi:hypothetical protein